MDHERDTERTRRDETRSRARAENASKVAPRPTRRQPQDLLQRLIESPATRARDAATGRIERNESPPVTGHANADSRIQRMESGTIQRKKGGDGAGGGVTAGDYDASATGKGRVLAWLTMKRKHIDLFGEDQYGHWWTEISAPPAGGTGASYGWWPAEPVDLKGTLTGVAGDLNGQAMFGGTPTQDPHHGDTAKDTFHPKTKTAASDADIFSRITTFVDGYSGEWRWTFGWGQNCHTFQQDLMKSAGLSK